MCIKVAILGLGTVGYGVYDIINKAKDLSNIKVVKILDKDFPCPAITGTNGSFFRAWITFVSSNISSIGFDLSILTPNKSK